MDGGEWKRMKGLGQHLATRRHGAAARASCSGGNEEERKEGWMRGERGSRKQRAGIVGLVRPRRMGGSGEVDDARAALCLLEVVAGDVIPPSRLGRRGDLAVAPSRRNLRASFVEARAWFALGLEVAGRTLPRTVRATTTVARGRR